MEITFEDITNFPDNWNTQYDDNGQPLEEEYDDNLYDECKCVARIVAKLAISKGVEFTEEDFWKVYYFHYWSVKKHIDIKYS